MAILETNALTYFYQDGDRRRKILEKTTISFEQGQFYTILDNPGLVNDLPFADQRIG